MAALLLVYHQSTFGFPFHTSYSFRLHGDQPIYTGFSPWRLWEILFGRRCGLAIYTPALFVSAARCWHVARNRTGERERERVWLIAALAVCYSVFYAF